jgi:pyruvate,water dikinase
VFDWLHQFIIWRDTERDSIDRSTFAIKRVFLEANRRLVERGFVGTDRDFWFLSVEELWEMLDGRANMALARAKIAGRMRNFERYDGGEFQPPKYLYKRRGIELDDEVAAGEDGSLRGTATSSGRFTGTARVIRSQKDLGGLGKGEILVCVATDPGWTPAFNLIDAIVTETGGALSHASCLAREYGLPAVQVPRATQLIPDGATITVDGGSGRVTIVEPIDPVEVDSLLAG